MIEKRNGTWFSIGVLTERYGAAAESFRNWERAGLIPPARRTPGGHRRYSVEHIEALDRLFGIARPERQGEASGEGAREGDAGEGRDALRGERDRVRGSRETIGVM